MKLLIDDRGNSYLVDGLSDFHTKYGFISGKELKKAKLGELLKSNTGVKFRVLEPDVTDFIQKAKRGPQAMMLKDLSLIAGYTCLKSGSKVVEAGVGSGVLSLYLANIVDPAKLTAYEIREDFKEIAEKNFKRFGVKNVKVKLQDIYDGIDEKNLDLVTLDLAEPWRVVEHAKKALKIGGYLSSYSPSINQSRQIYEALDENWRQDTFETILRPWKPETMRPNTRMLGHTGFLTIARLLSKN